MCVLSLGLVLLCIDKFLIQVHAIVLIDAVDVGNALLELTLDVHAILNGHVTHPVPPLLDVFQPVALLHQSLDQMPLVGRLSPFQLFNVHLVIHLPQKVVFPQIELVFSYLLPLTVDLLVCFLEFLVKLSGFVEAFLGEVLDFGLEHHDLLLLLV